VTYLSVLERVVAAAAALPLYVFQIGRTVCRLTRAWILLAGDPPTGGLHTTEPRLFAVLLLTVVPVQDDQHSAGPGTASAVCGDEEPPW
jgi:hypothetical protein